MAPIRLKAHATWIHRLTVAGLCALFGLQALWSALVHSGAADELGAHIPSGYLYARTGVFGGGLGNFPLGQLLIGLPTALWGGDVTLFGETGLLGFRAPVIALGLFLCGVIYGLGRALGGKLAGLVALALAATSPNLLAHGALATIDLPITAFSTATMAALLWHADRPGWLPASLCALCLGAALATKIHALALFPLILAAGLFTRPVLWPLLLMIPWAVLHVVYLHVPATDALLPPQWMEALQQKLAHAQRGHSSFLLGDYANDHGWLYFPIAIAAKTPLPALALVVAGLARRPSGRELLFGWLPAGGFVALAMLGNVQIGLRHVLVAYPFLFVIAGCGAARLPRWALGGLLGAQALTAAWTVPHHLSYFNAAGWLAGSHRVLVQSNFDWGLHDRQLARYVREHSVAGDDWQIDPAQETGGRIAINANAWYGIMSGGPDRAFRWLKDAGHEPAETVAQTWFIFRLDGPPAAPTPGLDGLRAWVFDEVSALPDAEDRRLVHAAARALIAVGAPRPALNLLDRRLRSAPGDRHSLALAGETIVRWKLGALRFEGDDYLGASTDGPALPPKALITAAGRIGAVGKVSDWQVEVGRAWSDRGDPTAAIAAWRRALGFLPSNTDALRKLAWCLSTCAEGRSGAAALRAVEALAEQTSWKRVDVQDLLGVTLAELGRFEEAAEAAGRAAVLAKDTRQEDRIGRILARQEGYRAGRPYRSGRAVGDE